MPNRLNPIRLTVALGVVIVLATSPTPAAAQATDAPGALARAEWSYAMPEAVALSDDASEWFNEMQRAIHAGAVDGVADLIDLPRMLRVPADRGLLGDDAEAIGSQTDELRAREGQLALLIAEQLLQPGTGVFWQRFTVLSEQVNDAGEHTVYGIFYDEIDLGYRLRWWLAPDGDGGLRMYDMEVTDLGARMSDGLAIGVIAALQSDTRIVNAAQRIMLASQTLGMGGDPREAAAAVAGINPEGLPAMLEGMRQVILATGTMTDAAYLDADLSDAEAQVTRALELMPEMHGARLLRATVRNESGDHAGALADLEHYHRTIGADAEMLIEAAIALDGLSRQDEAIDALRAAVALSKQQGGAVAHLLHLLPEADRDEAIKAYEELIDPESWIEWMGDDLWYYNDIPALERLREAHAARCPDDVYGLEYLDDTIAELRNPEGDKPLPDLSR